MTQSELEGMLDYETDPRFTTKTRTIMAMRRKTDNIEDMVKIVAMRLEERGIVVDDIHGKVTKAESFLHGLANIFKFGSSEAEKTYPSKRK